MKKFLLILLLGTCIAMTSNAQYVDIPDAGFRAFLIATYPGSFNSAYQLDTTSSAIVNEDSLNVVSSDLYGAYIRNGIQGIRYFKNLQVLTTSGYCWYTQIGDELPRRLRVLNLSLSTWLTSIPVLPDSLEKLYVSSNGLTSLPALPASLRDLAIGTCSNLSVLPALPTYLRRFSMGICENLRSLPAFPPNLKTIIIYKPMGLTDIPALPSGLDSLRIVNSTFTTLPPLPLSLTYLDCRNNNALVSLPVLPQGIKKLYCQNETYSGRLTALPPLPDSLVEFDCSHNQIQAMPALPGGLKSLVCNANLIGALPAFPNTLTIVNCDSNKIASIAGLGNSLQQLRCSSNLLPALPALPATLKYLACAGNLITTLPNLPAQLTELNCSINPLTALPVLPASLRRLYCIQDGLTSLPNFGPGLVYLACGKNRLTSISNFPSTLVTLYCNDNGLTSLSNLPATLDTLFCDHNSLTSLPLLPARLLNLYCNDNPLSDLSNLSGNFKYVNIRHTNIHCLPVLPDYNGSNGSMIIIMDSGQINCLPNIPVGRSLSYYMAFPNSDRGIIGPIYIPVCDQINNVNRCHQFPSISGSVYYDMNANGVKDPGEPAKAYAPFSVNSNANYGAQLNGSFKIWTDNIGAYNVRLAPLSRYNSIPANYNFNFTRFDTAVTANFALTPNSVFDSVQLDIVPSMWRARPGFSYPYYVRYENVGSTVLSPQIVLHYDNTRLIYDSCSFASVVDNGNSLTISGGTLLPWQTGGFIAYFRVKPTTPIGDTLKTTANISANSIVLSKNSFAIVGGSFDPNDKQATPQLSPLQVSAGEYIDYTIRFQNTGNDTAFNIIISDRLNSNLQASTLQVVNASHNCQTSVKNGVAYFEFLDVLLPDKNINEPKSHGFVSFKIKPVSTVAANTTIPNKAAIYFDYNAPIITNTTGTLIKDFVVLPLHLVSFTAVPQSNNNTALAWITSNETNTRHFVVEQSNDARHFIPIATVLAKGRSTNQYNSSVIDLNNALVYYRLKLVDIDGVFSYSPIVKIDRRKNTAGFTILNNPVSDALLLNNTDQELAGTKARLMNSQGVVVKQFSLSLGNQAIDVKSLPAGVYYISTSRGNFKFLKE